FTKKLLLWKANLFSIGGRLTLVGSVLGSLPIYFLLMFKAPKAVISKLESIRRRFFWGMKGDENKMVWIRWQKILSYKKDGGLEKLSSISMVRMAPLILEVLQGLENVHGGTLLIVVWVLTVLIPHFLISLLEKLTMGRIHPSGSKSLLCCGDHTESTNHCFFSCPKIKILWLKIWNWWKAPGSFNPSLEDILKRITDFSKDKRVSKTFHAVCMIVIWHVWTWRNKIIHAASIEEANSACHEDNFSVVQRLSLLWIFYRAPFRTRSWDLWVRQPYDLGLS
nr:RNA-directed DNA polymerase, eukaryota, reverse transcriptase zinc-binding domain protein [Tanacetum cinerariifolium]